MPNRRWIFAAAGLLLGNSFSGVLAVSNSVVVTRSRYTVDKWETDRGLPQNSVIAMTQTRDGYLWLGTLKGLARFDGLDFTVFDENNTPELDSSRIVKLYEDAQGRLWIATDTGGLAVMKNGQIRKPDADMSLRKLESELARQWNRHLLLTDGALKKWRMSRPEGESGYFPRGLTGIRAACQDREGNPVVGTEGAGVFWFDEVGGVTQLSTNDGLSHSWILSLLVDREGTLWIGTDGGGLNRVKRQVFDVLEESRGWVVRSVCEDDSGGLWIGSNGNGIGYWKDGVFKRFGPREGLTSPFVSSVFVDQENKLWAATGAGLLQLQSNRFHPVIMDEWIYPAMQAIHQDRDHRLWLGTKSGLLRKDERGWAVLTTRDGLSANVVTALADDEEGNLWIGTERGGLNRLRDGRFTHYRKKEGELPSDSISALWVDADGVLWIGTSSGLARFHKGKWTRYSTREGLISNSVGYLIEDGHGNLWIGSTAGLMRVPQKALNDCAQGLTRLIPCRAYGERDGLPTGECSSGSQPGAARGRDGKLWFPTIKGMVSVDPARLFPNTNPPPVVIESVLIDGQVHNTNALRVVPSETITVPAGKERVEIKYTSLNLAAPEKARFRYRLKRHETAWTEAGDDRVARYRKLPAGRYQFQVTACNEDGVWNETGSSLAFVVQPPFWRKWWFLSAAALSLLATIVGVVHYLSTQRLHRQLESLRQKEALEKDRARIARDIHDQLGANLTQVALLGELVEGDKDVPEEVEAHARQICQTARETTRTLDEIVWTVNPSNDTVEGLITYICKHAQDYLAVAGLRYRLDVPATLPDAPVLPEVRHNVFLASKEAITNIVRHAKASSVCVRLRLNSASFTLEIEDDGRGVAGINEAAVPSRNGLRNMRKRMEDVGGGFSIGPAATGGTLIRLTAPIGSHSANHGH